MNIEVKHRKTRYFFQGKQTCSLVTLIANLSVQMLSSVSFIAKGVRCSPYAKVGALRAVNLLSCMQLDSWSHVSTLATSLTNVNAWSVNGVSLTSSDTASNLFAFSLLPYLVMLFFLARPESKTPSVGNFGFQFLLVFVAATIPAGIFAKTEYHDILANVDWLHGLAESFLTITNLLIITGFRNSMQTKVEATNISLNFSALIKELLPVLMIGGILFASVSGWQTPLHAEPANALSLPTWTVHTSSIFEWLLAMNYIWNYAEVSNNPRWKGMSWAMVPSHASGLTACTYHFFYNSSDIIWMVALQAALTVLGNTCMAIAAYRIFQHGKEVNTSKSLVGIRSWESTGSSQESSSPIFYTSLALKSLLTAAVIKYGELYFDQPFSPDGAMALSLICVPVLFNAAMLYRRNMESSSTTFSTRESLQGRD